MVLEPFADTGLSGTYGTSLFIWLLVITGSVESLEMGEPRT